MCMCINDIFETIKGYTVQYVRGYILLTRTNDNSLGELSIRENMLMLYNNFYNYNITIALTIYKRLPFYGRMHLLFFYM